MPKVLSEAEVRRFNDEGYVSPVRVFDAGRMAEYRRALAEFEAREGGRLKGGVRNKPHLFLRWLYDLVTDKTVLDAVEDLIGPDILLYHAQWFIKEPNTPDFVSFHQDSAYWSLNEAQGLSAWVAFEPSGPENGCMQVIPGTHREAMEHEDRKAPDNMLWRGQTVKLKIDESKAVNFVLQPGEMSIHHARIVHGSGPNRSGRRRIGYSIRYIPARIARVTTRDSALLVRGRDYGTFDLEPAPRFDYDPEGVKFHAEMNRRYMENYMSAELEQRRTGAR
jgi:chlorinating enzyme